MGHLEIQQRRNGFLVGYPHYIYNKVYCLWLGTTSYVHWNCVAGELSHRMACIFTYDGNFLTFQECQQLLPVVI